MKKRIIIGLFVLALFGLKARAQQDPMYTMYMNQLLSVNPAYAGAKGVTSASLLVREQWVSWPGNPRTQTLFVHSPLNSEMGIGGSIINDKIGVVSNTGIFGDYSYTITYPGERYLSFGLKAGVSFFSAPLSTLDLGNTDPNDPAFQQDIVYKFLPNAGVGVYLSSPVYYIGLSVPKLISNVIYKSTIETETVTREQLHAFFMGGYVFDVNRIIKFKPYFMIRFTPNAPISADITAQAVFIEKLWVGLTYRIGNSFGFMAQVQATPQLKVGYAYDLTTTELGSYNSGTHELFLSFDFSFGRGRVRSPRYF
ncbi:MAG TPA: type IX secretion system membrane protein PorP/SprF [Prolixibacteraceae bacterium]|nr:type IX secretion system membrane protein PorP/SprF [Prolixibacteraceae bacterium]